jgi:hypothetical protein
MLPWQREQIEAEGKPSPTISKFLDICSNPPPPGDYRRAHFRIAWNAGPEGAGDEDSEEARHISQMQDVVSNVLDANDLAKKAYNTLEAQGGVAHGVDAVLARIQQGRLTYK